MEHPMGPITEAEHLEQVAADTRRQWLILGAVVLGLWFVLRKKR